MTVIGGRGEVRRSCSLLKAGDEEEEEDVSPLILGDLGLSTLLFGLPAESLKKSYIYLGRYL